jgi:glycosyltransferase 2 family protein
VTAPRWLPGLVRLGVTVALLALLVRLLGTDQITQALRETQPAWLVVSVAALASQIALSAWRWRLTAGALGLTLGRGQAVREYWLSVLGNSVLPGGVLGDLGRAVRLRGPAGLAIAAQSVVIERLAGQIALFAAAGLGAVAWFWPHPAALAGALGLAAGLWALVARARQAGGQAGGQGRLSRLLAPAARAWGAPGLWPWQLGLSLAILACNLIGVWAAARAVGVAMDAGAALLVIPLTLAAMLIPVSINGWGLREGAAAALWPLVGVAAPQAVAASVVFGLAALLAALPGVLALRGGAGRHATVIDPGARRR